MMEESNNEMKIKLLDDLIERIMSMEDGPQEESMEKPEGLSIEIEPGQEEMGGNPMKDKLAQLKGM